MSFHSILFHFDFHTNYILNKWIFWKRTKKMTEHLQKMWHFLHARFSTFQTFSRHLTTLVFIKTGEKLGNNFFSKHFSFKSTFIVWEQNWAIFFFLFVKRFYWKIFVVPLLFFYSKEVVKVINFFQLNIAWDFSKGSKFDANNKLLLNY